VRNFTQSFRLEKLLYPEKGDITLLQTKGVAVKEYFLPFLTFIGEVS
jgi:hypothetical protein